MRTISLLARARNGAPLIRDRNELRLRAIPGPGSRYARWATWSLPLHAPVSPAVISVAGLSKTYAGGFQALKNIGIDQVVRDLAGQPGAQGRDVDRAGRNQIGDQALVAGVLGAGLKRRTNSKSGRAANVNQAITRKQSMNESRFT